MQILPTWDLFIIVFFAIIIAYSFIVGRNSTIKIIIATYLAILTADGIGNMIDKFFLSGEALMNTGVGGGAETLVVIKILVFVLTILLVTVKGSFFVDLGRDDSIITLLATNGAFGFLSAGLIISTILVYIGGGGFVGAISGLGLDITTDSQLAKIMTENYNLWFSLPAFAFVLISFVGGVDEGGDMDDGISHH
ncbi:MAG: hypothetical protein PHO48_03925 [Candidatus Gracilibacteria bacterium]|nr:hypothetical protein [Candidatus Gracilibacteria bacterium]MDD5179560.1 hypothetical protein [Candidatus Gracilibacteria bacterium]